jgi:threonine dehydrogenase-like Zn-dependent dehydrogenase
MKTCYEYFNSEWVVSMSLMEARKIKVEPMVTKIVPLAQIDPVFQDLLNPNTDQIQVVVECN